MVLLRAVDEGRHLQPELVEDTLGVERGSLMH